MHQVENLTTLYRARRYVDGDTWKTFYEPCPVIKITAMEIIVVSQDMPPEILQAFPDFYAGGTFRINKPKLQRDGKAHHTRHGETFYISAPESAIALPSGERLVAA